MHKYPSQHCEKWQYIFQYYLWRNNSHREKMQLYKKYIGIKKGDGASKLVVSASFCIFHLNENIQPIDNKSRFA